MKLSEHNTIIEFIEKHASKCSRTVLSDLVLKYKGQYPHHTLLSIFLNNLQRKVKGSYHLKTKKENLKLYYKIYQQKIMESQRKNNHENRVLIDLAINFDLPPCLMARLVLEQHLLDEKLRIENEAAKQSISNDMAQLKLNSLTKKEGGQEPKNLADSEKTVSIAEPSQNTLKTDKGKSQNCNRDGDVGNSQMSIKNRLSLWIKDPHLIPDVQLREQILQCMSYDICYGPINDAIRHSIGLEFEEKLVNEVKKINLPFLDENDLRKRGYDKTPDVKLEVPIAVRGHPICWIESKASFGDLETHSDYLRAQYHSYWNRFGPGLVIYWFGFIEEISEEMLKQGILIMDGFPNHDDITFMSP